MSAVLALTMLPVPLAQACDTSACSVQIIPTTNQKTAVASGNWNAGATWSGGTVPAAGQNVVIPSGKTVTMTHQMTAGSAPIRSIWVQSGGLLKFSTTASTRLIVDTILVDTGGTLRVGDSATARIGTTVTAEIIFAGNYNIAIGTSGSTAGYDPQLKGRGLVSHGTVQMFGASKTGFVTVAGTGAVTGSVLTLATTPTGWRQGDQVLITGDKYVAQTGGVQYSSATYNTEDEVRTISNITGNVLTLSSAVTTGFHDRQHPGQPVCVANLTRNVTLSTDSANVGTTHRRGHTMFMSEPTVSLNHAAFVNLGRTIKDSLPNGRLGAAGGPVKDNESDPNRSRANKLAVAFPPLDGSISNMRGRYPVHFHKLGQEKTPVTMNGCVVQGSPGWGVSLHSSHGTITGNVTYDIFAAHFVTEDGDERGTMSGNLAVKSVGDMDRGAKSHAAPDPNGGATIQDDGQKGSGFWMQSRNMSFNDNYAFGHSGHGFMFFHRHAAGAGVPFANLMTPYRDAIAAKYANQSPAGNGKLAGDRVPIVDNNRNVAVGSHTGFKVVKANKEQMHDVRNMFTAIKSYNVRNGIGLEYTGRYTFRDCEVYAQSDTGGNYEAGIEHGSRVLDTAHINFKVFGWDKAITLQQTFSSVWDTPVMLYVGGTVKIKGAASSVPFDVVSTSTSTNKHVWTLNGSAFTTPWYDSTIHKTTNYNSNMDLGSAYVPPAPSISSAESNLLGVPAASWPAVKTEIFGTRTDSAGSVAGNLSLNAPGYYSNWDYATIKGKYLRGEYYTSGGKTYMDLTEHVVDRTTGHLRSYTAQVELTPYP